VPWHCLKWSVTLRDQDGDVDLTMGQALQVFAAVELGRVLNLGDVRRALAGGGALWPHLMAGARGLRPGDAAGDMHVRDIAKVLGVTGGEWHFSRGQAGAEASLREALAQLQGAA